MSNSVFSLVAVQRGLVPTVQPIIPTFFEPLSPPVIPPDETLSRPVESQPIGNESAMFLPQPQPYRGNLNPIVPTDLNENAPRPPPRLMNPASESPSVSSAKRPVDSPPLGLPAAISDQNESPIDAAPRITVVQQFRRTEAHTLQPTLPENQALRPDSSDSNSPAPVIQIHIGQIYVRATRAAPSRSSLAAKPPAPKESLDDYLNARDHKKS